MKWYLIWLIVSTDPDSGLKTGAYEDFMPSERVCEQAKKELTEKLLEMNYKDFTVICEGRVDGR